MNPTQILIIEDDADINHLLCRILSDGGYTCRPAFSGTEGLLWAERYVYDLILLDLMLPGMTGEAFITQLREKNTVPIIVLSAKSAVADRVNVLKLGADDFLLKPFDNEEVLARVEAQLRRARQFSPSAPKSTILVYGGLTLNRDELTVTVDGTPIPLTARELSILTLLMEHPKKVFSRGQIYEQVWGEDFFGDDNTVNVHVSNLRSKIAKYSNQEYIKTVWGFGFKLCD